MNIRMAWHCLVGLWLFGGGPMLQGALAQDPAGQKAVTLDATSFEKQVVHGWRATRLIGLPVVSKPSTTLGRLRNLMLDGDGRIEALVVVGQGRTLSRDLGFRIPWSLVQEVGLPKEIVVSAAAGEALGSVFSGPPESVRPPDELPVTGLIGDTVMLSSGREAGYVTDLVFSADGNVLALLVSLSSDSDAGVYAFRLSSWVNRWEPERGVFHLPYASADDAQRNAVRIASEPYAAGILHSPSEQHAAPPMRGVGATSGQ